MLSCQFALGHVNGSILFAFVGQRPGLKWAGDPALSKWSPICSHLVCPTGMLAAVWSTCVVSFAEDAYIVVRHCKTFG